MSDELVKVTVCEGKYTFGQRKDGSCYALRYGDPWREDIFDGLPLAMAHRIEELEAKQTIAMNALTRLSTSEVHGNGEALGCVLSSDPMGREIVARMEYARDIIAKIKGEQP